MRVTQQVQRRKTNETNPFDHSCRTRDYGPVRALHASTQTPEGQWSFSLTPYVWAPDINITLKYSVPPGSGGGTEVESQPNDYLENLDMAMMISGEARKPAGRCSPISFTWTFR